MRKLVLVSVALCLAAAAAIPALGLGAGAKHQATKPPMRIGVVLSLSGPGVSLGQQEREGIELKAAQLNAKGGINGRRIVLRFADDESTPDRAVQVTRSMIQSFDPDAIVGSSISATCLAMKPVTEEAKVLQFCLSAVPIPTPAPYFFSGQSPFTRWIADLPTHWMVQRGIKSVGCLASSDSSGQLTLQVMRRAMTNAGIKFSSQTFNISDTDVTPQLIRLRAENPDALYVCTTGSAVVTALQGIRQLGFNVPVWISSGSASRPIAQLIKNILPAQGAYTSGALVQVPNKIPKNHARRTLILEFAKAYRARFKKPADIFAASGADALNIVARTVGSLPVNASAAAMTTYMEDKIRLSGVHLSYNYQPNDHRGTDVEGIVERFTSAGGFQFVAQYQPGRIPRYSTR